MKNAALVLCLGSCMFLLAPAVAQPPGRSNAFGESLGEWMALFLTWALDRDQPDHVGKMKFLPLLEEGGEWTEEPVDPGQVPIWHYTNEADFTLHTGEKFCSIIFAYWGERYADGSVDQLDDPAVQAWMDLIHSTTVKVWVDDKLIISSEDEDYLDQFYDQEFFEEEFTTDGGRTAVWSSGYGFVHEPLSKGGHTVSVYSCVDWGDLIAHYMYTWNITVQK